MKVKVGCCIYDGEEQPVMVILSKEDKENIANMSPEEWSKYLQATQKEAKILQEAMNEYL